MTRPFTLLPLALLSLLVAAQPAAAGPAERAVDQCRAEMLGHFAEGAVRSHRVLAIAGNSRRTRVTIRVEADRRYTFECATDARGRIALASFDPPRASDTRLAAGQR